MTAADAGRWDPIAGVDLDTYARIVAGALAYDVHGRAVEMLTGAAGIPWARWTEARAGWMARIREHEDVRAAYAQRHRAAIKGADC